MSGTTDSASSSNPPVPLSRASEVAHRLAAEGDHATRTNVANAISDTVSTVRVGRHAMCVCPSAQTLATFVAAAPSARRRTQAPNKQQPAEEQRPAGAEESSDLAERPGLGRRDQRRRDSEHHQAGGTRDGAPRRARVVDAPSEQRARRATGQGPGAESRWRPAPRPRRRIAPAVQHHRLEMEPQVGGADRVHPPGAKAVHDQRGVARRAGHARQDADEQSRSCLRARK